MHIYNIGYDSYEESEYAQLYHKKKFSDGEFEEIVMKAVLSVLKENEIKAEERVSFQAIFFDVVEELIKDFGFKEVKFTSQFNVFGWADILDKEDWKDVRDKHLNRLTDYLKKSKVF